MHERGPIAENVTLGRYAHVYLDKLFWFDDFVRSLR